MKKENCEIRQAGVPVLTGDEISIGMIFNNLTGQNIKGEEYTKYKQQVALQGFDIKKPFEMYKDGIYRMTGNFQ